MHKDSYFHCEAYNVFTCLMPITPNIFSRLWLSKVSYKLYGTNRHLRLKMGTWLELLHAFEKNAWNNVYTTSLSWINDMTLSQCCLSADTSLKQNNYNVVCLLLKTYLELCIRAGCSDWWYVCTHRLPRDSQRDGEQRALLKSVGGDGE